MEATDPAEESLAIQLYTKEYYDLAYRKLGEDGVLVTHIAPLLHKARLVSSITKTLSSVFPRVCLYAVYVKSLEALWSFAVASKKDLPSDLSGAEIDRRLRERGVSGLRFYSGEVHEAVLKLTQAYLKCFGEEGEVLTDEKALPKSRSG